MKSFTVGKARHCLSGTYRIFQALYTTLNKRKPQSNRMRGLVFFLPCLCLVTCRVHLFPWDHSLVFLCHKMNAASLQLDQISYGSKHTHSPGWFTLTEERLALVTKSQFSNRMSWLVQKTLIYYTAWKFCLLKIRVTLKYLFFIVLKAGS